MAVNAAETRKASDKATVASDRATLALARSARVQEQVFQEQVKTEKICTDSHPENCQALFDRLLKHTTLAQARQWVCDGLARIYQAPVVVDLRRRTRCPPPTPPGRLR